MAGGICQGTDAVAWFVDPSRITWLASVQKGRQDAKSIYTRQFLVRGWLVRYRCGMGLIVSSHANTRPRTKLWTRSSFSFSGGAYDCNMCSKACRWISNASRSLIMYC